MRTFRPSHFFAYAHKGKPKEQPAMTYVTLQVVGRLLYTH